MLWPIRFMARARRGGCMVYSVYPDMIEWWMREEGKSKSQQSIRISTLKLDIRESTR